jgi:hypothetical protein
VRHNGYPIYLTLHVSSGEHYVMNLARRDDGQHAEGVVDGDQVTGRPHARQQEEYFTIDGVDYGPTGSLRATS